MKLLAIVGPTASGKSELAVECARRMNGEIVSCDAFCIYRGLDIGTAKPDLAQRGGIAHHLIDVADPRDSFSVSDFERLALSAVNDIAARGKLPILCGGTGFYVRSVLYCQSYGGAAADEGIRAKYAQYAEREGKEALHRRLAEVDEESARVLHPNDVKRVIRALEIYELTGKRKSEQRDDATRFDFEAVAFDYPRSELYERIGARVRRMLGGGLIEEVRALLESGVPETAQSMQGIGYKEVIEFLKNGDKESTLSDIIEKNTRNYAKRQLTFFRKMPIHWIAPKDVGLAAEEVIGIYEHR